MTTCWFSSTRDVPGLLRGLKVAVVERDSERVKVRVVDGQPEGGSVHVVPTSSITEHNPYSRVPSAGDTFRLSKGKLRGFDVVVVTVNAIERTALVATAFASVHAPFSALDDHR